MKKKADNQSDQKESYSSSSLIKNKFNKNDQCSLQISEEESELNKEKECRIAAYSHYLYRSNFELNEFLLVGDVLIEINNNVEDFDSLMVKALLLQDKKSINNIQYFKDKQLIHVTQSNKYRGSSDFSAVIDKLLKSQNQQNKMIAEEMSRYQYHVLVSELQYLSLVENKGQENLYDQQNLFFNEQKDNFINNNDKEDCFAYFGISFLEQTEFGLPLNVMFGISESLSAILGCDANQMIEIIGKTSHFSFFLGRDIMPGMVMHFCQLMQLIQSFQNFKDISSWQTPGQMLTLDGILVDFTLKACQKIQRIDGLIISTFYTSEFIFDQKVIQNIIKIRQSKSNYFNPRNILDLLVADNIQNQIALKFYNFISDDTNFKPPSQQELYPNKTCKYRDIIK